MDTSFFAADISVFEASHTQYPPTSGSTFGKPRPGGWTVRTVINQPLGGDLSSLYQMAAGHGLLPSALADAWKPPRVFLAVNSRAGMGDRDYEEIGIPSNPAVRRAKPQILRLPAHHWLQRPAPCNGLRAARQARAATSTTHCVRRPRLGRSEEHRSRPIWRPRSPSPLSIR